jgi:uncharacterized DUF497 family protein
MQFAWDERKASANAKKHRVSFTRQQPYSGILWQLLSMTQSIQRPSTVFLRSDCLAQAISWLCHTPIEGKRHGSSALAA